MQSGSNADGSDHMKAENRRRFDLDNLSARDVLIIVPLACIIREARGSESLFVLQTC